MLRLPVAYVSICSTIGLFSGSPSIPHFTMVRSSDTENNSFAGVQPTEHTTEVSTTTHKEQGNKETGTSHQHQHPHQHQHHQKKEYM